MEFSSRELLQKYNHIIDTKITSYDENLEEIDPNDEELYDQQMFEELFDYCGSLNQIDTLETRLFKIAKEKSIVAKFLYYDNNYEVKNIFQQINPLNYDNFIKLNIDFRSLSPLLSYTEFLEGFIWKAEGISYNEVIIHYNKFFPDFETDFLTKEAWEKKVNNWKASDSEKLEKIILRQLDLMMNSIQSDIKSIVNKRDFEIISRSLFFNVEDTEISMNVGSLYDKFIFCEPSLKIPFIKIILPDKKIFKVFTDIHRSEINQWLKKDERIEEDSPFKEEEYIYFLIKLDENDILECYLSNNNLQVNAPSTYNITRLEMILKGYLNEIFQIEIFDMKEKSIEINFTFTSFPVIDPIFFKFYMVNNNECSLYVSEASKEFDLSTRKVKIQYKPVSDLLSDEYYIRYEHNEPKIITARGPNEKDCLNFFTNIVGRTLQAFFLRQDAINLMMSSVIFGNKIPVIKEKKDIKKKKNKAIIDAYLYTQKDKIHLLKSINGINLENGYSSWCQCEKQPIILTDEEVNAWLESVGTIYDKANELNVKNNVASFTVEGSGKNVNFACPNPNFPNIYLVKKTKDTSKELKLAPCCYSKPWEETIDRSKILTTKPTIRKSVVETELETKRFTIKNIEESLEHKSENIFLSLELKNILLFMLGPSQDKSPEISLGKSFSKLTKNSLMEAIMFAMKDRRYSPSDFRKVIHDATNQYLFSQEAVGEDRTPEYIKNSFADTKYPLESSTHYRALEEYFNIHIYVFKLDSSSHIKYSNMEYNFELETPPYKIYPIRNLYRDRHCVILIKDEFEYQVVTVNDKGKFPPYVSAKLMDLFNYTHQMISERNTEEITVNLYSRMNWMDFFKDDPIEAQEIDMAGKTRIVQLKSGMTVVIPPAQPFNVPLIEEYHFVSVKQAIKLFGKPKVWDEIGVWYPIMGIPNMFYILTGKHNLGILPEGTEVPLNIFRTKEGKYIELLNYRRTRRITFAIIQILQWAWRIDKRPPFKKWLNDHSSRSSLPGDLENVFPDNIHVNLPESFNGRNALAHINVWWSEMFTPNGRILLWDSLYKKIVEFFNREEKLMGRDTSDPIMKQLVGFYETSGDYPTGENVRIFMSDTEFQRWARIEKSREENPEIKVYNTYSEQCIKEIMEKEIPIRVSYKNHYVIVNNISDKSLETALQGSYYWRKTGKRLIGENYVTPSTKKYQIITLGISKKYQLVEIDSTEERDNHLYVLKYPDESYASVLV